MGCAHGCLRTLVVSGIRQDLVFVVRRGHYVCCGVAMGNLDVAGVQDERTAQSRVGLGFKGQQSKVTKVMPANRPVNADALGCAAIWTVRRTRAGYRGR